MLVSATVPEIRAAEQPLLDAGVPLMDQAAHAVAAAIEADGFGPGATVDLLIGSGNNGGDALWAGKYLRDAGFRVTAYLVGDSVYAPGLEAFRASGGSVVIVGGAKAVPTGGDSSGLPSRGFETPHGGSSTDGISTRPDPQLATVVAAAQVATADVIIDGLLGIGASGAMRGIGGELVTALNNQFKATGTLSRKKPWVVAVDCPSGVNLDGEFAGQVPGPALKANHTITFGAPKPGLLLPPASHYAGQVTVENLGMAVPGAEDTGSNAARITDSITTSNINAPVVKRLTATDVANLWAVPGPDDQKYTRGVVGVVAGTNRYPGAAILATKAAVNTGVGMVRYLGPDDVTKMVIAGQPEVVAGGGRVQSWVFGPGIPTTASGDADDGQRERIRAALAGAVGTLAGVTGGKTPAVVDAGALEIIPTKLPPWIVLTPHSGELAALLSARGVPTSRAQVEANPLAAARKAQELTGATVLLKGATTIVVGADGQVYSQAEAPAWLATAGAGDVLAGLLGAMLAQHSAEVVADPGAAGRVAAAAALLHGYAAAKVNPGGPITASKVAKAIPKAVAKILTGN